MQLKVTRSFGKITVTKIGIIFLTVGCILVHGIPAMADATYHNLASGDFTQTWDDTGLITTSDDWSGVPGILGYRGDGLTAATGVDPQTVLGDGSATPLDVNANQTAPDTYSTGGVTEFHITDPVVALSGSGTADAPFLLLHVDTTGRMNITIACNVRDIDGSTDDAVQQVAIHYRVGTSGDFTNLPAGYIADATTGPSLATLVTPVSVTLPAAADNQAQVQVRIMTTNASGNDEWVGIDDITISSQALADNPPQISSTTPADDATDVALDANITINFNENVTVIAPWFTISCAASGTHTAAVTGGPQNYTLNPDADFANSETCTVTVLAAQVADQDGTADNMTADYVFDFTTIAADIAPTITNTTPINGATGVAIDTEIMITFSEDVDVTGNWAQVVCTTSDTQSVGGGTLAVSGGPSIWTLNPATDFVNSETCTVTVYAAQVTDRDVPYDNMAADYPFVFTTALPLTYIHDIQGSGASSPMVGQTVAFEGIVVGDYQDTTTYIKGFFVQEEDTDIDGDSATSEGIFVYDNNSGAIVAAGDRVHVTGTVSEYYQKTQVTATAANIAVTGTGLSNLVTAAEISLPFTTTTDLEAYEGMLVSLPQTLYVTEHYLLGRGGLVVLSANARLQQPTNVVEPGTPANDLQTANNLNRIILDDGSLLQNPDPIIHGRGGNPLSAANTLRGGDTVTGVIGVVDYGWAGWSGTDAYRIYPVPPVNFTAVNARPATPTDVGGTLKVASANLLNYFNTFTGCTLGIGGAATDCRGADNQTEFDRQRPKTVIALVESGADVIGVMEMENDGYGTTSAIQDLVNGLNVQAGAGTYAFIDADALIGQVNALGVDAIKVGLIYKPAVVTPVASATTTSANAIFDRPPLAQTFQTTTGEKVTVVVNHFKSKGCDEATGLDLDQGDGQGCWNDKRKQQATALLSFINDMVIPTAGGDTDVLIIGDLNSYALEDPIDILLAGGYTNLVLNFGGTDAYSYVYDGQWGYLDHALASASVLPQVTGVEAWHINADEPSVLDYNMEYKSSGQLISLYAADQYRVSDHDLVSIGLALNRAPTDITLSNNSVAENQPVGTTVGTFTTTDPNAGNTFTYSLVSGTGSTDNASFTIAGNVLKTAAMFDYETKNSYSIRIRTTDQGGLSFEKAFTITVTDVAEQTGNSFILWTK